MNASKRDATIEGRRALVLGLGRFTGGVETVRFLAARGATVLVSDSGDPAGLETSETAAREAGAEVVFGEQTPALLDGIDLLVVNPAIPFDHPVVTAADERGVRVTTEMNLFLERVRAPVLGVTGTKGKSTTATILAHMLEAAGRRTHLGGNVGRALVAEVDGIEAEDVVVLEMSSFQLFWTRRIHRSPHVTVVTNLFGDHLDRHGSLEHYATSKRAALDFQSVDDIAVLPADDEDVRRAGFLEAGTARRVLFGSGAAWRKADQTLHGPDGECIDLRDMELWGRHNRRNALAAAAAAAQVRGVTPEALRLGACAAKPLPHRLAPVAEVGGVLYIDDSNATNPTSTIKALEACPRPAVVLVGGKSKGLDPTPLLEGLARHAKAVVGIGTTGPSVVEGLGERVPAVDGGPDLDAAVRTAASLAVPGDAVLLSPAFSSHDQYPSFVVRGERFQAAVHALARTQDAL